MSDFKLVDNLSRTWFIDGDNLICVGPGSETTSFPINQLYEIEFPPFGKDTGKISFRVRISYQKIKRKSWVIYFDKTQNEFAEYIVGHLRR